MKQTTTGLFYFDWIYYISLLNVVTSLVVIIATFSLSGARLFFVPTFVGECFLVIVSFCWIFLSVHKVPIVASLFHYASMFTSVILLGATTVALEEISTCYFADYDSFKHIADCANLINRGTTTTFNVNSPRVCEGQSYDDSMLGTCVAAQVSVDYIRVARAVGVIAAVLVLLQVVSLVIIAVLYIIGLRTALDEEAAIESQARFRAMVIAVANEPDLLARFMRVSEYLGKASDQAFQHILTAEARAKPPAGHTPSMQQHPGQRGLVQRSGALPPPQGAAN
jgi:hypothetical protein